MRASVRIIAAAAAIVCCMAMQSGCGYRPSKSTTVPGSGLKQRAFVTNQDATNGIEIVDASKDQLTGFSITLGGTRPQLMVPGATNMTLVFNAGDNGITMVDNTKEAATGSEIPLPGATESLVASTDGKAAYAAIRSASVVSIVNLTNNAVTNLPVPEARRVVLSHNGAKLLVFSDDLNSLTVVNTADNSMKTVPGFDRPIFAVFSSDDSKAYVLDCGPECGGSKAGITLLDIGTLTPGSTISVDAATIATSDGSNLYVAGTGAAGGKLNVVGISSFSVSKSIGIGDGFHNVISIFSNKVFVGARTCTTGCLSIADASAGTAVVDAPKGDVTAIAPITPRSVAYVTEGGELRIYNASNGAEQTNPSIDIVGKVTSVVFLGQ